MNFAEHTSLAHLIGQPFGYDKHPLMNDIGLVVVIIYVYSFHFNLSRPLLNRAALHIISDREQDEAMLE
jgi:hypothetical protein